MESALEGPQTPTNTLQWKRPWWYGDDDDDDNDFDDDHDDHDDHDDDHDETGIMMLVKS